MTLVNVGKILLFKYGMYSNYIAHKCSSENTKVSWIDYDIYVPFLSPGWVGISYIADS